MSVETIASPIGFRTKCLHWPVYNIYSVFYIHLYRKQNRSTEGCSKLKRSVYMTSSGKDGLNIRTNASPKWVRTRCPEGKRPVLACRTR